MRSKKFLLSIASIMLVSLLVLAGCGSSNNNDANNAAGNDAGNNNANNSGEEVTVDIFQFKVEIKEEFEDLVKVYEEENPNVTINVKTVGGGNDYGASLKTAFSSGEEPDIFNVGGPQDVQEYRDYVADLSDTEAASKALEGTLDSVTEGEEVFGLPFNQEGYGLVFNKEMLAEADIDPADIQSMDDLEEAVKTLDGMKEELGIDAVFALPGKELWVLGDHIANQFFASDFNNDIREAYEADSIAFDKSDEFKRYIDLQSEYSVQPVLSLDYSQQVEEYFSLERVAMIQGGNWIYNSIHDMDPEFAENGIDVMPVPVEGQENAMPAGVPMYWAVNDSGDDAVVQASKDFLDWMYTSEIGKTAVLEDFKFIPAYEDFDSSKVADPLSQTIFEYSEAGNTMQGWVYSAAPHGWSQESLGVAIQKYLSGDISWDDAIEEAQRKWEEARQ